MNDHQSTAEHFNIAGELGSSMCANCIHIPVHKTSSGRPDLLWTVNMLARSITKWNLQASESNVRWSGYVYSDHKHSSPCHGCA